METVTTMMIAESATQLSCRGRINIASLPRSSVRSMSAPVTPSMVRNLDGGNCVGNGDVENVSCNESGATDAVVPVRRVTFPVVEVTGIVEPPNPWVKAVDVTSDDIVTAYVAVCDRYQVIPLDKVVQQVQRMDNFDKRVSCLDLRGEELDAGRIEALEEVFKRVQFNTVNLENASLSEEGATALFDIIEYYESVQHLIISRNKNFSLRGWQGFCRMIKSTHCLGELELAGIPIGDNMNIVARTLKMCSNLATLHLENCNLSGKYFSILMNCLVMNNSLRELYVANNRLSSTDAVQIGNYLKKNSKLKLLHLGNNQLEDTGIGHIADGLTDQSAGVYRGGLTTLVVHNNHLSNKSTRHVAQLLSDCRSLAALDIGQNNLNNEFIHSVKDPLIRNHTLISLCLKGCRLTCVGAVALAEYIADSSNIQVIDLRDNNIKIGGLMALTHSMEVSASMTKLKLDGVSLKEQLEDPEHRHQDLLFEIAGYCERNHASQEKKRAEEEAAGDRQSKEEVLSEPVTRLLSLWSNQPTRKTSAPCPPPPITVSSIGEKTTTTPTEEEQTSGWQKVRGTSHFLRSPLLSPSCSPIPSPTKNRFRVTRVFQEADSVAKNFPTVVANNNRFNKFTVTPVRTINGVDALIRPSSAAAAESICQNSSGSKLVQRKSDSDLLSSMSSSSALSDADRAAPQPEVQRLLDTAKEGAEEDAVGLYSSTSEEEGEDSVFMDVPAIGPNHRIRHDSMRVHRRRLSNSDELCKQTLEPLLKRFGCSTDAKTADDRVGDVSEAENVDNNSAAHEKFGLQNAVDSMEINTLKAGYLKDLLEAQSSSSSPPPTFESVDENDDGEVESAPTPTSLTNEFCGEDEDDDDPSSCGDRDSGIYLLDTGADDLGTPRSEQSEEENLADECAGKSDEILALGEDVDVDSSSAAQVTLRLEDVQSDSVKDSPPPSPSGISFSLVDIGENDYFQMVANREYSGSWLVTTADGRVRSVHKENDMFRCSSSNSLVDLLTGVDEWKCSPIIAGQDCEESGDLMLFIEKDRVRSDEEMIVSNGGEVSGALFAMHLPKVRLEDGGEISGSTTGHEVTEVVSAWISRNASEWTDDATTRPSPPKNVENVLQRIGNCDSESSNSSDSGVPESPMSCSPPVVVDPTRNSPSKRKAAVLSANGVGLGLDVLERLDLRTNSMPVVSPGRGLMDMAAEFLMSREGLNGTMENRRESASGCLGLNSTVGRGIAKEATTTST